MSCAGLPAPLDPHPRLRPAARRRRDLPLPHPGADALGLSRVLRAGLAGGARSGAACAAGWMRSASSTRLSALAQIRPGQSRLVLSRGRRRAMPAHRASSAPPILGHPLIPDERRVGNDVVVGPPGTLLLITGSNMSGKSTLLRSIGLNAVLAQAGGPVCATALRMPAADIESEHPRAGFARAGPVVFHGGAGALERRAGSRAASRTRAAWCCICSTRSCRAPTPPSGRSPSAASRATCSTPVRSAS